MQQLDKRYQKLKKKRETKKSATVNHAWVTEMEGGKDAAPRHCKPAMGSSIIMVIFLRFSPFHTEKKKRKNRVEAEKISP